MDSRIRIFLLPFSKSPIHQGVPHEKSFCTHAYGNAHLQYACHGAAPKAPRSGKDRWQACHGGALGQGFRHGAKLLIQENEQLISNYAQWVANYFEREGWNNESPLAQMAMSIYHTDAIHQEAQKDYPGLFQLQFFDSRRQNRLPVLLGARFGQNRMLRGKSRKRILCIKNDSCS
mgnify:CR=1 FL=1